ncbi:MAG: sigma-54-dependent Fis family transcriptional regulator [Nitrospiraceae bacterium]|nr:MAG: sigma-54-dependent Fis family transcriptional regulator [Nitrospiraceae bacterium]
MTNNLLILDLNAHAGIGKSVKTVLSKSDFHIQFLKWSFEDYGNADFRKELNCKIDHYDPDLMLLVLPPHCSDQSNVSFHSLFNESVSLPVIVVLERSDTDHIISLLHAGAADFIIPPLSTNNIIPQVSRLITHKQNRKIFTNNLKEKLGLKQLVGKNSTFIEEKKKIPVIGRCNANVLIIGETGTGKELFARAIHYLSLRAGNAFIPINCGAIPVELIENEMFGHIQGAFTGASISRSGLIQEADKGTLFLDEVDSLTYSAQIKLLHLIQDKVYRQLGSTKQIRADIRIIAATNSNLEDAVKKEKFRRDLFYRLNVVPIMLPPLRERRDDIPILSRHFLEIYAKEFDKEISGFTSKALRKLLAYDWPGNVRELENIIERAVIFSEHEVIKSSDIILTIMKEKKPIEPLKIAKARAIEQFEMKYIQQILLAYQGNITRAAEAAQKNRRAFWELIRKYKIDVQDFKHIHKYVQIET